MSVELYPNIADLYEKLSALEDAELAERIVSANPQLFPSAASQEEISIFAAAWKRFGTLALAVTAALAVGAGYVFASHAPVRPAVKPLAVPVVVHKIAHRTERLVVHPARPVTISAPVAVPVHHTVVIHHPAASHVAAPAVRAMAAPPAASSAGTPAEAPIQYEANAQVVSSANAPPTDAVRPDGTKNGIVAQNSDASSPLIVDSCTPQGGRLGYLIRN